MSTAAKSFQPDAAEAAYRRVLAKDPGNIQAEAGLAHVLIAKKQYAEAETLARKALESDRNRRFATAREFAAALDQVPQPAAAETVRTAVPTEIIPTPAARSHDLQNAIIIIAAVLLLAVGVVATWLYRSRPPVVGAACRGRPAPRPRPPPAAPRAACGCRPPRTEAAGSAGVDQGRNQIFERSGSARRRLRAASRFRMVSQPVHAPQRHQGQARLGPLGRLRLVAPAQPYLLSLEL